MAIVAVVAAVAVGAEQPPQQRWSHRAWEMNDLFAGEGAEGSVRGLWVAGDASLVIGTTEGLLRFNGDTFSTVPLAIPADESPLVGRLMPGRAGEALAVFGSGRVMSIVSGSHTNLAAGREDFHRNLVAAAIRDADGAVWVLHASNSSRAFLRRIVGGHEERIGAAQGLGPDEHPSSLALDSANRIWIACAGSLRVFRNGRFEIVSRLPMRRCTIAAARSGGLWVTAGGRIYRFTEPEDLWHVPIADENLAPLAATDAIATCRALREDSAGRLWISSSRYGLFVLEHGHFQRLPIGETWATEAIEDGDGNIWVGTRLAIHRLRPSIAWPSEAPTWRPIHTMAADGRGATWFIAFEGPLYRQPAGNDDPAAATSLPDVGKPGEWATAVASPGDGTVWIGLSSGAVLRHADGVFSRIPPLPAIEGSPIGALVCTSADEVWATANAHLLRLKDGAWNVVVQPPAGLADSSRSDLLAVDAADHIWAVCGNRLVRTVPDGSRTEVLRSSDAIEGVIRGLVPGSEGGVWIAVDHRGLMRWRDGVWATVDMARGLATNGVAGLAADQRGRVWCGAPRMVFVVDLAELDRVADGTSPACHCWTLPPAHDTAFLEAVGSPRCPVICDDLGRMLVSLEAGIAVCDPAHLRSTPPPPVLVERVVSDHTARWVRPLMPSVSLPAAEVSVPPGSRRVELTIRPATLAATTNLRIEYRLDGIDDRWHEATRNTPIVYTSLPAGAHGFRVRSSSDVGRWEADAPAVVVVVEPPFHETWLFRTGVLGAVAAASATVVAVVLRERARRRLVIARQEAAVEHERMRLARDMHDAVGTNLTQIALLAEIAKGSDPAEQAAQLDTLAKISRDTVAALDELVWEVNPGNDDLRHLLSYVCGMASETLRRFAIHCRVERPATIPPVPATAGFRRGVLLLVKEAVTNVVSHADAGEVVLRVALEGGRLRIAITDDGVGIDPDRAATGDGLGNMRQRAAELGGRAWIESGSSSGTTVHVDLPLALPSRVTPQ